MSGGSRSATTTSTSTPWKPSEPYLKQVLADTQDVYESGQGFSAFPGSTVVPYSNQTMQAMQGIEGLASQGNPLGQAASQNIQNLFANNGINPEGRQALQGAFDVATGANQIGGVGDFQNLMGEASSYLQPFAQGDMINGGSPQFQAALDYQAGKLGDDINRGFSMAGRYGSGAHTGALAEGIGNFRNQALSSEIGRQEGIQQSAINQLLGAKSGALGSIAGIQGSNIANQIGAGQGFNNALMGGQSQALSAAGLTPQIYEQQFAPYQQLANVGAQYEDLATRQLMDSMQRFNTQQQEPWTRLANYNALVSGAGQLGNTQSQTVPGPSRLQTGIGGAFQGAGIGSAIPGIGTGIGALLGGLGGLVF